MYISNNLISMQEAANIRIYEKQIKNQLDLQKQAVAEKTRLDTRALNEFHCLKVLTGNDGELVVCLELFFGKAEGRLPVRNLEAVWLRSSASERRILKLEFERCSDSAHITLYFGETRLDEDAYVRKRFVNAGISLGMKKSTEYLVFQAVLRKAWTGALEQQIPMTVGWFKTPEGKWDYCFEGDMNWKDAERRTV